ncbi:MalY/PatB family protein [Sporichthya polymorpha]|uniref:MalY/PatB family protein n=1 Tax=Sporichthya polymorpha TaxID=35751 RepID=UPI00037EF3AD|nr:PatB family C-S lyase [Sporichthya polymorpha]
MISPGDSYGFDALDLAVLHERHSTKWRSYPPDVLPAWVAEMDFGTAPPVAAAIEAAVERGDLGYAVDLVAPDLTEAFCGFAARHWSWEVDAAQVHLLRDTMRGIELWIETFTAPGDGVVVTTPVYYPFLHAISGLGRRVVAVPVLAGAAGWELDLDGLESAFRAGHRLLLLCNPHNPVGRAYPEATLRAVAELAERYDVRVVSDEIHAPLVFSPAVHVPFATLGPEVARRTMTVHSASKAFNLAGLGAAVAVIGNEEDAKRFREISYRHRGPAGILGIEASVAAYHAGDAWLAALVTHLQAVRDHLRAELTERLPEVAWAPHEGTYLAWLDCRALRLTSPQQTFLDRGRVAFNDGAAFGPGGDGFVRLNFGTSRAIVIEIVTRMQAALAVPGDTA